LHRPAAAPLAGVSPSRLVSFSVLSSCHAPRFAASAVDLCSGAPRFVVRTAPEWAQPVPVFAAAAREPADPEVAASVVSALAL
jgi:hypothetical protein